MKINHRRKQGKKSYGKIRTEKQSFPRKDGVSYPSASEVSQNTVCYVLYQTEISLHNGFLRRHGRGDHLDKSMQSWGQAAVLSGRNVGASIGNDFSKGNRGMAKAVRGAKKFVRSRVRFHENQATRELLRNPGLCE
ncbi:hypothetical protein [Pseudosulfitobacter pseudonitzschiae]|uniref:hypothetical protein n=1 Tax=Pseudosulfitobacter pseudonitzschiae TaxID=1402135 RepID=UPI003B7C9D48